MYDGSEIDKRQMDEWLNDTIDTILNGGRPGNVLEIGTGSGMILFNITEGLQSYVGLEPSTRALNFVTKAAESVPGLADKVTMFKATATDLGKLGTTISANLVILNSVIQHFPSQVYLFNLVQDLLQLDSVKALFFGDIRSYTLHREFLAARAMHVAGEQASKDDVRRILADMEKTESELLIDPAFFTVLPTRLPDQIEHVEILPKKMYATNELSSYRYAAVIHVKNRVQPQHQVRDIDKDQWIDFAGQGLTYHSLLQILRRSSTSASIAISNIPHNKSTFERYVLSSLDNQDDETSDHDNWISSARRKAQRVSSLSFTDLVGLAAQAGYRVETSWARPYSQNGGLDAMFHRYRPKDGESRVLFRFPGDHRGRPYSSLTSDPLRRQRTQKMQNQLQQTMRTKLFSSLVSQVVTVLDKMPFNNHGQIDRQALLKSLQTRRAESGPDQQPMAEAELQIRKIWGQILNAEPATFRPNDRFFQLGGDSIDAMKVVHEAGKAGLEFESGVADVFFYQKLQDVARRVRTSQTIMTM